MFHNVGYSTQQGYEVEFSIYNQYKKLIIHKHFCMGNYIIFDLAVFNIETSKSVMEGDIKVLKYFIILMSENTITL